MRPSGPPHPSAKALTPGRSSDPEDLVRSPCTCGPSRSARVWNFALRSREVRRGFSARVFSRRLYGGGKSHATRPAYRSEAIRTKGRRLVYLSLCDSEALGAPIAAFIARRGDAK